MPVYCYRFSIGIKILVTILCCFSVSCWSLDDLVCQVAEYRKILQEKDREFLRDPDWVREQIKKIAEADQKGRLFLIQHHKMILQAEKKKQDHDLQCLEQIDRINQESIQIILSENGGWLSCEKFGSECEENVWMIILHSPDLIFQKSVLSILEQLLKIDQIQPSYYAYLFDKVACSAHEKQRYGTQLTFHDQRGWDLCPVEDKEHLDTLRQEFGLESVETYVEKVKSMMFGKPK